MQAVFVDWLGAVFIHACLPGETDILHKGVGGHRYDPDCRGVLSGKLADFSRSIVAVHDWHLDIHKDQVKIALWRMLKGFHCTQAIFRCLYLYASQGQQLQGNFPVEFVVLRHQNPPAARAPAGRPRRRPGYSGPPPAPP